MMPRRRIPKSNKSRGLSRRGPKIKARYLRGIQALYGCFDPARACETILRGGFYRAQATDRGARGIMLWQKEYRDIIIYAMEHRLWKVLVLLTTYPVAILQEINGDQAYLENYKFVVRSKHGLRILHAALVKLKKNQILLQDLTPEVYDEDNLPNLPLPMLVLPRPPVAPLAPPMS